MRKVKLFNLRVNGNRIPQDIWDAVAERLLPGPEPSESEKKHGKSKSAVLKRIVATDSLMRRQAKAVAGELMSAAAKGEAVQAGWALSETAHVPAQQDKHRFNMAALKGRRDLPWQANGEIGPCSEFPNGLAADGTDYIGLMAEMKEFTKASPPSHRCGRCSAPATRKIENPLIPGRWEHYCDLHGPSRDVPPVAVPYSNVRPYAPGDQI